MTHVEYSKIDIDGSQVMKTKFIELVNHELGGSRPPDEILQMIDYDSGSTDVFGGFVGGELVSTNAFIRTRFARADGSVTDELVGYQSGFSATASAHRGKGHWPGLMKFAERALAREGATFLFGFSNPTSRLIKVGKLGYGECHLYNFKLARVPMLFDRALASRQPVPRRGWQPRLDDLAEWKTRSDEDASLISIETEDGRLLGKVRHRRRFGLAVRFLEVGIFNLAAGGCLKNLLRSAAVAANIRLLYISINPDNDFFGCIRSGSKGQPITLKALDTSFREIDRINFFGGMRDTF